jgi:hypothetical protein
MDCMFCYNMTDMTFFPPHGAYGAWSNQDWSTLATTNVGGGLLYAGNIFNLQTNTDALWVVVLLTDGKANATTIDESDNLVNPLTYPIGYCPNSRYEDGDDYPLCFDHNVNTRHNSVDPMYDADDYARDMADYVACAPTNSADACNGMLGQGALVFAIGLGPEVLDASNEANGTPYGGSLLRYIAAAGYNGDPDDPICDGSDFDEWCGNYYYAPGGSDLDRIFEDIASRIFTRIHQ